MRGRRISNPWNVVFPFRRLYKSKGHWRGQIGSQAQWLSANLVGRASTPNCSLLLPEYASRRKSANSTVLSDRKPGNSFPHLSRKSKGLEEIPRAIKEKYLLSHSSAEGEYRQNKLLQQRKRFFLSETGELKKIIKKLEQRNSHPYWLARNISIMSSRTSITPCPIVRSLPKKSFWIKSALAAIMPMCLVLCAS